MEDIASWAHEEVGQAELGDARRTARLTRLLARVAASPAGRVTQVFDNGAEREAAYRFLENDRIAAASILEAHRLAVARRAAAFRYVYVAIDQSAMQLTDRNGSVFGPISGGHTGTGVQAMSALVRPSSCGHARPNAPRTITTTTAPSTNARPGSGLPRPNRPRR
jgi:hypothetical protein